MSTDLMIFLAGVLVFLSIVISFVGGILVAKGKTGGIVLLVVAFICGIVEIISFFYAFIAPRIA